MFGVHLLAEGGGVLVHLLAEGGGLGARVGAETRMVGTHVPDVGAARAVEVEHDRQHEGEYAEDCSFHSGPFGS